MPNRAITITPQPIHDVVVRFVLETPETREKLDRQFGYFQRLGVEIVKSDFETVFDLQPDLDRQRPRFQPFQVQKNGMRVRHLDDTVEVVNEILYLHVLSLFGHLRAGSWIAIGVKEPPDHELSTLELNPRWWKRADASLKLPSGEIFRDQKLSAADQAAVRLAKSTAKVRRNVFQNWETIKTFSEVEVLDEQPWKRLSMSDAAIGNAIALLADPPDRAQILNYFKSPADILDDRVKRLAANLRNVVLDLLIDGYWELRAPSGRRSNLTDLTSEALLNLHLDPFGSRAQLPNQDAVKVVVRSTHLDSPARSVDEAKKGRPSRAVEIQHAFTDLLMEGQLDFEGHKSQIYRQVLQRIFEYAGSRNRTGLSQDAIRKNLAPKLSTKM